MENIQHVGQNKSNSKFLSLGYNTIRRIFSFLTIRETIPIFLSNTYLRAIFKKSKMRHFKILKFFKLLFSRNSDTMSIFLYLYKDHNYNFIRNKFKILTEKDLLIGFSLFLTDLSDKNKSNNIFYVKFSNQASIEFVSKFIEVQPLENFRIIIDVEDIFHKAFYRYLSQHNILIDELNLLPTIQYRNSHEKHSHVIQSIFDHKAFRFNIKSLKIIFYIKNLIKDIECLRSYFFNNKNSIRELDVIEWEDREKCNDNVDVIKARDSLICLIEYNSDTLSSLKLDFYFDNYAFFSKTLARCRFLKTLSLKFNQCMIENFLPVNSSLLAFVNGLNFCRSIENIHLSNGLLIDPSIASLLSSMKCIKKVIYEIQVDESMDDGQYRSLSGFNELFPSKNVSFLELRIKYISRNQAFESRIENIFTLDNLIYLDIYFHSIYDSYAYDQFSVPILIEKILMSGKRNIVSLSVYKNKNIPYDSNMTENLISLVKLNTSMQSLRISTDNYVEELMLIDPASTLVHSHLFSYKSDIVDSYILSAMTCLYENVSLTISNYYQPQIFYRGKPSTFCDFFKSHDISNYVSKMKILPLIKGLTFQYDTINLSYSYQLRDFIHKLSSLEIFEFKNVNLKADLFDIISDKIMLMKNIKNLSIIDIDDFDERSLLRLLTFLNLRKLTKIVFRNVSTCDELLEFICKNKNCLGNLVTLEICSKRKMSRGMDYLNEFFNENYLFYEFILSEGMIADPKGWNRLINNYIFLKIISK